MSLRFLQFLTPPPVNVSPDYDGLEYKWKFLTFRPALFKNEVYFVLVVVFYVSCYVIGKKANERRVNKWFEAHLPLLQGQFSKPVDGRLIQDGNSDWFNFSTGRRAVTSLHTTFKLRPRHDALQYLFQIARGMVELEYKVYDEVELDFTFKETPGKEGAVPECVWAVVAKDEIRGIRERRWDLTFTKTTDQPNLPPSLTVMSEFADITTNLLKPHGTLSLPTVLSSPTLLPYFRSLSLTDQPCTRPSTPLAPSQRSKHLILTFALPSPSDASATIPLLDAAFQLVDVIAGSGRAFARSGGLAAALSPETKAKLKKTREEVDRELKQEAQKEKKEEQAEERATAKRKAEQERLSRLSATEQKKEMEREKKRLLRKTQGKMKVR
ncbi:hypothetical protein AcW2_006199 [Taiwanofungus camphoratus]|nr:hypothetical protein AcW2_006199 [Antrodia cinnamomea]